MGTTIFAQRASDDGKHTVVTCGKWTCVPTGPWCALERLETIDRDDQGAIVVSSYIPNQYKSETWNGPARLSADGATWWHVGFTGTHLHFALYQFRKSRASKKWERDLPFETPADHWSHSYFHADHKNRKYSATVDLNKLEKLTDDWWFMQVAKASAAQMTDLEDILTAIIGADLTARVLAPVKDRKAQKTEQRLERTQDTRAKTSANKERGGNPKSYQLGDRVISTYPRWFHDVEMTQFWYAQDAHYKDTVGFYTRVNAEGKGLGMRYRIGKKQALRACQAAFDLVNYQLSMHEQLTLLMEQAQAEEIRARQKAQDTDTPSMDHSQAA